MRRAPNTDLAINAIPIRGLIGLWIIGLLVGLIGLGAVPLRDFDEAIVARVALELSHHKGTGALLPTLWNEPYINKPPGLHWLIAILINLNSVLNPHGSQPPPEIVIRLFPAIISSLIIPICGLIQWQLKPGEQFPSLATSAIFLTLLPIARHGRLAMLDGPCITAMALIWLLLLSNNRTIIDYLRMLAIGITSSFILMLKAPLLVPTICAALIPIFWGRELKKWWRWPLAIVLLIGLLPGISWHIWHGISRGDAALWLWGGDGAVRVLFDPGEGSDLGWKVPLIEILEGGWPWLLLWPIAIAWAWKSKYTRWGKWTLGTQITLALTILPLKTQLPWYSHPLWIPFGLLCGPILSWLITRENKHPIVCKKVLEKIPLAWILLGSIILLLGLIGTLGLVKELKPYSTLALAGGLGWATGGLLIYKRSKTKRRFGFLALLAGNITALALLMGSSLWLWELNESWAVQPVAKLIEKTKDHTVVIAGSEERPSLNWYAGKQIKRLQDDPSAKWILTKNPKEFKKLNPARDCSSYISNEEWTLLSCN
ncbi:4-amino-4-deoxy-L-arabinose transferase [Prochlorococcus sp. MIT 1341]|uniref:ArnT family glycosyltransferase n=1 Tax=Prochlorococcus sp. MIT 1341 TaxID=3096221 RepID=UPI002A75F858|nr:4-amino-4-deoxy-L-arabinose transferase [Prochlorococcus sp. MIT 1341]